MSRKRLTASPNPTSRKPLKKRTRSLPALPSRKNRPRQPKQINPPSKSSRQESAAVQFQGNPPNSPSRKRRLRSLFSRSNREKRPGPVKRNRLFISILPSFTLSKTTRSKSAMMRKWRQWWKALKTRALPSPPLCVPVKMADMKSYRATAARKPVN